MRRCRYYTVYVFSFFSLIIAVAKDVGAQIPDVHLGFTVQKSAEGKLDPAYHRWSITCWGGEYRLIVVTINRCVNYKEISTFTLHIDYASTIERTLKVVNLPNNILYFEDTSNAETIITARIGYAAPMTFGKQTWFNSVVSFSGGAVKNSSILGKVITWELIPLKNDEVQRLDCEYVYLHGLQTDEKISQTHTVISESGKIVRQQLLTPRRIRQAQTRLQATGFDPGPIDGVLGRGTREAIRQYQKTFDLPVTGELDSATLEDLGIQ